MRDVVITGVGVVSPIGIGREQFWNSLVERKSGIRPLQYLGPARLPAPFGGEITDFEPKHLIKPRKSLKLMCREVQFGVAAAQLAVEDAELPVGELDATRLGVSFGAEMYYGAVEEMAELERNCLVDGKFDYPRWGERFRSDLFPLWMLKYLPNMPACHIAIAHDALGPNNTISQLDVSSLLAIKEGVSVIRRGSADVMIVGGTGSYLNLLHLMFRGEDRWARWEGEPSRASRPFDADRRGMVRGEGAAAIVLESREFAESRGKPSIACVAGSSAVHTPFSSGFGVSSEGIARSISLAMEDAQVQPDDLSHVNANGVATMDGDQAEAEAISQTVPGVAVTAPKSYFGNLAAGTGAVEAVASILSLQHGVIPPTLNCDTIDPQIDVQVVAGDAQQTDKSAALVLNQSYTGQSAALVLTAN